VTSFIDGSQSAIRAKKVVNATYYEESVPSRATPSFQISPDANHVPINDLVNLAGSYKKFVVIGAGKTGVDAVTYLMQFVRDPSCITWVVSQDYWYVLRETIGSGELLEGIVSMLKILPSGISADDLFLGAEKQGLVVRLDPSILPTKFKCGVLSIEEVKLVQQVNVVRQGRVTQVTKTEISFVKGPSMTIDDQTLVVNAAALGNMPRTPKPIFDGNNITIQPIIFCNPALSAACCAFVEATYDSDDKKNAANVIVPHVLTPQQFPYTLYLTAKSLTTMEKNSNLLNFVTFNRTNWFFHMPLLKKLQILPAFLGESANLVKYWETSGRGQN